MASITGASEKLAGLFYDWGAYAFHTQHPNSGMKCNNIDDDYAAFNTLVNTTLAASGGTVDVGGTVKIGSNLSIPSNVRLRFLNGGSLAPTVGVTITVNGRVLSDGPTQIFFGSGSVVLAKGRNPTVWAEWFGGADIGAKISAAVVAVSRGPATIKVSSDSGNFATAIDVRDTHGITITAENGNLNSITDWGPNFIWTGGAGSGSAVKANGSVALELRYLDLSYSNAAYDGNFVSLSSTGGIMNTSQPHLHHCRISGTPTAKLAARLIELNITLGFTLEHCTLDYAVVGIGCSGGSNNIITIGEGNWLDKHFSDCAIKGWGHT
jgi:hypothetical protein